MKRFCKGFYIYRGLTVSAFFVFFIFISLLDLEGMTSSVQRSLFILLAVFCVGILFWAVYLIVLYNKSVYEVTDEGIRVERGVFFQKKSYLAYDKMNAINKKQGLLQRIFNVQGLFIDSGSTNTMASAEIIIYQTPAVIEEIIQGINQRKYSISKEDVVEISQLGISKSNVETIYQYSKMDKLVFLLMNFISSILAAGIICVFGLLGVEIASQLSMEFFVSSIIFFIFIVGLTLIVSIIMAFFRFYNFKITKTQDELFISYGLFVTVENKLPLQKVRAVRIERGIIKRLFGYVCLNLDIVGYGTPNSTEGGDNTIGVLLPLCKIDQVDAYLQKVMPQYLPLKTKHHSKGIFPRISYKLLSVLCVAILMLGTGGLFFTAVETRDFAGVFILVSLLLLAFLLIIIIINEVLAHKNAGIVVADGKLTLETGGFIKKTIVVLRENIVAIDDITTYFRRKKSIYSYNIYIHSDFGRSVIRVDILDSNVREELLQFLQY